MKHNQTMKVHIKMFNLVYSKCEHSREKKYTSTWNLFE